nr:condensation domain-containing protein [uncultured bacterium]
MLMICFVFTSSAMVVSIVVCRFQCADYAVWQREWLQGEVLEHELAYWRTQLAGAPAALELPTDHPRPPVQSFRGAQHSLSIAASLSHSLKALSQREGVTLFMTLLAAFQTLLSRYSGQDEVVVGTPIAGRNRAEIEPLIGFFVNTLVLRTDLAGDPSFSELLRRVREVSLGAYAHQDVPFEKLVEELQPERDMSRSPLFQVMFAFEHAPAQALKVPALSLTQVGVENRTAKFDLTLSMLEAGEVLGASLEYNTDLFEPESIERMLRHLHRLLEGIVTDPRQRVSELPLLSEAELHQLLYEWNETATAYPSESCIHQLFEAQVERAPEAVAVVYQEEQLSYGELNRRANQLAHYLRSVGVGPESLVGILLDRSLEMVIALLGVLKAGAAYVPLDPQYPLERLSFMIEDARLSLLLTEAELVCEIRLPDRTKVVCLGAEHELWAAQSGENVSVSLSPSNLAYVIYTSGSTGHPKGVLIAHRALVNHSTRMAEYYSLQGTDRVLQFASLSFDVAAEELFPTWLSGATVVFQEQRALASLRDFLSFVEREKLSVINLPTPYWHELVAELPRSESPLPSKLRLVIVGSDQALPEYLGIWQKHVGERIRWINAYGPTEAAITTTTYEPARAHHTQKIHNVPIGRPIANKQVYLLDKHLNPVPVGVVGELYIGGEGLARGYLNRPEMSAERFIPNPFNDGVWTRLYRTGDMGRRLLDGNIELHGRSDQQVKIRGYRIELGEVEAALTEHPEVRGAAATVRAGVHGDKRLVAYLVAAREKPVISEVRKFLRERLPEHMIPSAFAMLDALPLTLNGKVDRQALPAPDMDRPALTGAYVGPHTEMERRLVEVWQEILQVKNVGVHDNFFDLGGHSLSLIQVQVRLQELLERDVPVVEMFRQPTISSLAMYLGQTSNERSLVQESYERAETRRSLRKRKRQFRPADDVKPRL